MSDTVKLIIEIPEETKQIFDKTESNNLGIIGRAVKNGTPLDDVKVEIEKHQFSREYCCDHNIDTAIDMGMVRIILDNIGKAESDK